MFFAKRKLDTERTKLYAFNLTHKTKVNVLSTSQTKVMP